jgi:hypothetical protein
MATIVKHTPTGTRYILLGTGFGAFQSKKPNWLLGDLVADTTEGQYAMVCVCDKDGSIGWLESSEVVVETVDGQNVKGVFG